MQQVSQERCAAELEVMILAFDLRQASEQTFTSFQFLAHFFRQVIGRPQVAQGFEGRERLFPLNESVPRVMPDCSGVGRTLDFAVPAGQR
jgi:hypothetical protein